MKRHCLTLLLALTLVACGLEERSYPLDEGMLTAPQSEAALKVGYRVPRRFLAMSDEYIDYLQQRNLQDDPFAPTVRALYVDTITGANIALTDMRMSPAEQTEERLEDPEKAFNAAGGWDDVSMERFRMNGYPRVAHVRMSNPVTTADRYYFYNERKAFMSLDLVYPTPMAEAYRPYFESMLATVREQYEITITAE